MRRPDVTEYLRQNLPKFRVEDLRRQLRSEGVPDEDIEDSLDEALRQSKGGTKPAPRSGAAAAALAAGALMIGGVLLFALTQKSSEEEAPKASTGESGYVGHRGWVVRMPKDYAGFPAFKDAAKTHEVVHFAKAGTDPTNFLNEGLFGQMGIVRVEALPSPFPANPAGIAALTAAVSRKTASNGDKFVLKNMTVAGLSGVQVNVQAPFPRVEAYLIGKRDLYFFYGGQDDDIWRDILLSLRDMHAQD